MLIVKLDRENTLALLEPVGALNEKDFLAASSEIDPLIESAGQLNGLIIHTESFPGWDSFAAFVSHLKFVKNHHQKIKRIALVSDSMVGSLFESLAGHFVDAQLKQFPYDELDQARNWILSL